MRVGVVGAGTMGSGIAHAFLTAGADVILVEPSDAARKAARRRINTVIDGGVSRGKLAAEDGVAAKAGLIVRPSVTDLPPGLLVVVEAVPELVELKQQVLPAIEHREPKIIGTNTSSLSIDQLAATLGKPERLVGMHFFNPVWSMSLVELVTGRVTAPEVLEASRRIVQSLGKECIVVRDTPGFASSRLGIVLGLEAIRMVEEEVASPADIDTAMVLGYGHPMGPLRLSDLVGLDVRLDIARHLAGVYGERFKPPTLLERMVADGKLGQKTGRGFYSWD